MAPQTGERTPEEWITRLWGALDARAQRIQLYEDYYEGRHRLRFTTAKAKETFGDTFRGFADNFCLLVVDAVEERLKVRGFRAAGDSTVDPEAARIWAANDMDAQSSMAHTEALVNEESYVIVWVDPNDRETPLISAESPFEVIVERDTVRRRLRLAALKRWVGDDEHWYCVLYLPDFLHKFRSRAARKEGQADAVKAADFWEPWVVEGEESPLPNPLGVVPVVPFTNMPRLGHSQPGTSEIKAAIPLQDAINKTVFDSMIASEFVAYPQRWMIGVDIPKDENDQPVEPFKAGVNRIWFVDPGKSNPTGLNPSIGQFPAADMSSYVDRVDAFISHLAAITKTPRHYLIETGGGTNLSGETVKTLEAPLVSKARNKHAIFGVGWQECMALALRLKEGGAFEPGDEDRIEVDWSDPETRTEAQHVDALVKLGSDPIKVPREQLWADAGYTPEQIARFKEMEADAPAPPPPAAPVIVAPVAPELAPSGPPVAEPPA
jgi:Phage portal protein, SPP1 Gp6-like